MPSRDAQPAGQAAERGTADAVARGRRVILHHEPRACHELGRPGPPVGFIGHSVVTRGAGLEVGTSAENGPRKSKGGSTRSAGVVRPVYATGPLARGAKGATIASTGPVYGSASQFGRSSGTSKGGRGGGIVHEAMGSENELYDLDPGAHGGSEEVQHTTVFDPGADGGRKDATYANVDQTRLTMQRKSSPASASSGGGGGGGKGRAAYDTADHADAGLYAVGYDAVQPQSGVVVYGIDDGGVGSTAVYDTPPVRGAGTRPVYSVPSLALAGPQLHPSPHHYRSGFS